MNNEQPKNPLHGVTLKHVINCLVDHYGWKQLSKRIEIRCFFNEPSIQSSLKFLRKTPWARTQVEELYLTLQNKEGKKENGKKSAK